MPAAPHPLRSSAKLKAPDARKSLPMELKSIGLQMIMATLREELVLREISIPGFVEVQIKRDHTFLIRGANPTKVGSMTENPYLVVWACLPRDSFRAIFI
jgi:hypothetical protein